MSGTTNDIAVKYVHGWSSMMVDIWHEKIRILEIHNTGFLYSSISALPPTMINGDAVIPHKFVEYGLYVDAGTGKGYSRDNGGDLGFHPARSARPWFNEKYYKSFMALRDAMADIYGQEFVKRITVVFRH